MVVEAIGQALDERRAAILASLPSLMDESEYTAWEAARQSMLGHLSNASPAERYRLTDRG